MKKVEEFNKTQMLMDEFKKIGDKNPKLEQKINGINKKEEALESEANLKIERANLKIEKLQDEMNLVENDINRDEVLKEYEKLIQEIKAEQDKEIEELNKQKEEINEQRENINKRKEKAENETKEFFTDERAQTITLEIKDMEKEISAGKSEIKKKEIELQQKDVELQEFYDEKEHENPLRWQEIYNEKDAIKKEIEDIKKNIEEFNKKIEEYSSFKQEIFDLKYPKKVIELDEEMKVKPEQNPEEKSDDKPQEEPEEKSDDKPQEEPEKKSDDKPQEEPKKETKQNQNTKLNSKLNENGAPKPNEENLVGLGSDLKIVIGRKGLKIHAPGVDEKISLRKLKKELKKNDKDDLWSSLKDGKAAPMLSKKRFDEMDPSVLFALNVLKYESKMSVSAVDKICTIYSKEGKVPEEKSLKGIIEYDRTGLDYLKPRNIISRIINKKQFNDIRHYADISEENGMTDIKYDEPGKIRRFLSNIKNKLPLLVDKDTKLLEEETKSKYAEDRGMSKDEKALLEAMNKYREGKVDYQGEVVTGVKGKAKDFREKIHELSLVGKPEEASKHYQEKTEKIKGNKERANAFAIHNSITKEDKNKDDDYVQ